MSFTKDLLAARAMADSGVARMLRKGAGLSLEDVARDVGVTRSTICRWELRQTRPRGSEAVRYAEILRELASR